MPAQSLTELQQEARLNYAHWPLWLLLKRHRLEKLLAQTASTPTTSGYSELQLLRELGLPLPDDLSPYTPPEKIHLQGSHFTFEVQSAGKQIRLILKRWNATGKAESLELMYLQPQDRWYLDHAVKQLNQGLETYAPDELLQAVRFWVTCHGVPAPTLTWQVISDEKPQTVSSWE